MTLSEWASKWNIPHEALMELFGETIYLAEEPADTPEGIIQQQIRLEAASKNKYLYRNNRGAGKLESGSYVRFGLANDSKRVGDRWKSGDLIGWETLLITRDMVGTFVARFLSVECKRANWKPAKNPDKEETAQLRWMKHVNECGGRALITNRVGVL